jgi:hypothetical protein
VIPYVGLMALAIYIGGPLGVSLAAIVTVYAMLPD